MKGMGPRHERETVIVMDEEGNIASLWTASEPVYRRMLKRGWVPTGDYERHATFEFPKQQLRLPRPKSATRGFASRKESQSDAPKE